MGRFLIIENDVVVNAIESSVEFAKSIGAISNDTAQIGWVFDGDSFSPPPPAAEEVQAEIVTATQQRLDDFAKTRNYDGILSLCTYATSTVPKFAAEGQYGVEARDSTWAKLYQILAEVKAGTRPMPAGFEDIEPELPALAWPAQI